MHCNTIIEGLFSTFRHTNDVQNRNRRDEFMKGWRLIGVGWFLKTYCYPGSTLWVEIKSRKTTVTIYPFYTTLWLTVASCDKSCWQRYLIHYHVQEARHLIVRHYNFYEILLSYHQYSHRGQSSSNIVVVKKWLPPYTSSRLPCSSGSSIHLQV